MMRACQVRRRACRALLLVCCWSAAPVFGSEDSAEPVLEAVAHAQNRVQAFHGELIDAVAEQMPTSERYERLRPVVAEVFNSPVIARLSLGRTWRDLSADQRSEFAEALADLIAATYADRFRPGAALAFALVKAEPGRRGPVIRTQLERTEGQPVSLDYHFRSGRIYNVVADGVSDLSLRRADYNTVVKTDGFAALLLSMRSQQRDLLGVEQFSNDVSAEPATPQQPSPDES